MTKLSQLKIDPEFQNQINPPSFEETHQLEMNILKEERVLNPIITWNGYIVDGHTRYQILRKYPFIPFEVIEKEFSSRYEALVWICKNQLGRRNLTPEQKKFLIGKQAEAEKQIKSFHGNQYTLASESGLVQNEATVKFPRLQRFQRKSVPKLWQSFVSLKANGIPVSRIRILRLQRTMSL